MASTDFGEHTGLAAKIGQRRLATLRNDPAYDIDDWVQETFFAHKKAVDGWDKQYAFTTSFGNMLRNQGWREASRRSKIRGTIHLSAMARPEGTPVEFAAPEKDDPPFSLDVLMDGCSDKLRLFLDEFANPSDELADFLNHTNADKTLIGRAARIMGFDRQEAIAIRKELVARLVALLDGLRR